jgi:F-type H+-transporting ATPase subunit delta
MSAQTVATRYAKSLIDLAQEQNKLDVLREDILSFQALTKNRDFYNLLKSPVVSISKKRKIIDLLMEGKVDEMMLAFIRILLTKGREGLLPEIAAAFIQQYRRIKNISTVKLTSATKLSDEVLENVKRKLIDSGATEDQIMMTTVVDPQSIGGFILEFGGNIYDSSVAHKLELLRKKFNERNVYVSLISQ